MPPLLPHPFTLSVTQVLTHTPNLAFRNAFSFLHRHPSSRGRSLELPPDPPSTNQPHRPHEKQYPPLLPPFALPSCTDHMAIVEHDFSQAYEFPPTLFCVCAEALQLSLDGTRRKQPSIVRKGKVLSDVSEIQPSSFFRVVSKNS